MRIATRRSALARAQTAWVARALAAAHPGLGVTLVEVTSAGDADPATPVTDLPQVGAFTKALQDALLDGRADLAVHSLKDLPTAETPGLVIAAVPSREDPRDALVSRSGATLGALRPGARVGTGSPRRAQQILAVRPDVDVADIRGNVDTRLTKVRDGSYEAAVLALAGLRRLGREAEACEVLDFLPAPGQGALALECRAGDAGTAGLVAALHDADAGDAVAAERAWLGATGAGCRTSAAAHAVLLDGGVLRLRWFLDGRRGEATDDRSRARALGTAAAREALPA